jgi:hypothetical protein
MSAFTRKSTKKNCGDKIIFALINFNFVPFLLNFHFFGKQLYRGGNFLFGQL